LTYFLPGTSELSPYHRSTKNKILKLQQTNQCGEFFKNEDFMNEVYLKTIFRNYFSEIQGLGKVNQYSL